METKIYLVRHTQTIGNIEKRLTGRCDYEVTEEGKKYIDKLTQRLKNIKFDIIVSNPPYIRTEVINSLDVEVQQEPITALDGGKDGLDFYRKIVEEAYPYLKLGSHLCFEIGYDQKIDVIEIIDFKSVN